VLILRLPGMHLLASSVLSGSANAFLTLRVGILPLYGASREDRSPASSHPESCEAPWLYCSGRNREVVKATVNASKMKLSQAFRVVTGRRSKVEAS
jgi:hypothetical protein